MDLVILTMIWIGSKALRKSIAGVPVGREIRITKLQVSSVDILAETAVGVGANGIPLHTRVVMSIEVFGIDVAKHIKPLISQHISYQCLRPTSYDIVLSQIWVIFNTLT